VERAHTVREREPGVPEEGDRLAGVGDRVPGQVPVAEALGPEPRAVE